MADAVLRLLLPGTLCDARVFGPMRAHWPDERRVQVADLHRMEDPEAWCHDVLAQLPEPFDVLGFSLGAILAMMLLDLAPERVRRGVLVSANPQAGTLAHAQRVQAQRQRWLQAGPRALAQDLLQQTTADAQRTPELTRTVQDMAEATPLAAFDAQGRLNASRPDGGMALARWRGPLLLVSGATDPWCGADKQALLLQSRPDALFHELPDTGHYLPLERPEALARLTDDFLN